ncbi:Pentatricopeptide repeat-containing protein [Capsicum chinense]|nr:Pentatricopeptide repeat-containing protein [Capsicum chinense]
MLFRQMKEPNWITFVAVLYACSHAGLVDEAQPIFSSMVNEYNITPKLEHYGCMVDLYGRANRLREALELVETMPMARNVVIWGSLIVACRIHGEFELGEFAAKRLLELDPEHDGAYVFLSNVYAKGLGKVILSMGLGKGNIDLCLETVDLEVLLKVRQGVNSCISYHVSASYPKC